MLNKNNIKILEGCFGDIEIITIDGKEYVKKVYQENRTRMHQPEFFVASNKLFLFENITEHEAHEALLKFDTTPKIYSYNEVRWLDIEESKRPKLNERLGFPDKKVDPEKVYVCTVVMELVKKPNLSERFEEELIGNRENCLKLVKLWFKNFIDTVQKLHVLSSDRHAGNMLSDLENNKIIQIDYGFYFKIRLIDELSDEDIINGNSLYNIVYDGMKTGESNESVNSRTHEEGNEKMKNSSRTQQSSTSYQPIPISSDSFKIFKGKISTKKKQQIYPTDNFNLTQYDAEMILAQWVKYEFWNGAQLRNISAAIAISFRNDYINIFEQAMNELNFNIRTKREILNYLLNPVLTKSINMSVDCWLGTKSTHTTDNHYLLTLDALDPNLIQALHDKTKDEIKKFSKMENEEIEELIKDRPKMERRFIWLKLFKLSTYGERLHLLSFINDNKEIKKVFRCEFTNRFNGKIKVGDELEWKNITSSTTLKDWALSFADNYLHSGGDEIDKLNNSTNSKQNYLFEFENAEVAHLRRSGCDFTTYNLYTNRFDVNDKHWFNQDCISSVLFSIEYLMKPNVKYAIESIDENCETIIKNNDESRLIKFTHIKLRKIN